MPQTLPTEILGTLPSEIPSSEEYLTLHFSPLSTPRKQRWRNHGLSADFLGDYFATFFPGDEIPNSKINRQQTVKASVSYIANELLENAVKYSDEIANLPISITLYLYQQEIIFQVVNYANQSMVENYQRFIQNILGSDLVELYLEQMEKSALGADGSYMGLLTMMYDYASQFGWHFQPVPTDSTLFSVSVTARLAV